MCCSENVNMAKLLVIRRNRLGDAVSVLPWLQGLKEVRPDLCIHVLTNPYAAAVFQRSPVVSAVFVLPEEHWGMPLGVLLHPTLRRLRKQEAYDYVVNASYSFSDKAAIVAFFVPGRLKTGAVSGKGKFLDRVWDVPVWQQADMQALHQVMRVAFVGKKSGLGVTGLPVPILKNQIQPLPRRIALCPSVNRPESKWSDKHWAALEQRLSIEGYAVVWIAHKPLKAGGELLVTESSDAFFDALALSGMVVCCEGGTSHVASALGVPTIAISGVDIRNTWCPWVQNAVVLERTGLVDAISENDVMVQIRNWEEKKQFLVTEHAYLNPWSSRCVEDVMPSEGGAP